MKNKTGTVSCCESKWIRRYHTQMVANICNPFTLFSFHVFMTKFVVLQGYQCADWSEIIGETMKKYKITTNNQTIN